MYGRHTVKSCDWKIYIDGSKPPDMSHVSSAAVTRSQAKQSENAYRKVPDPIINEKEGLKQAQSTDPKMDCIRRRVESGNVTVSSGLNRDELRLCGRTICCLYSLQ